jgi:L-aspartate semialdehyde sulfurtransferase ferredoxin
MSGATREERVRLTFPEDLVKEPFIARLVRQFDVTPNVRRANVEEHMGWMVCELDGATEDVERAIVWLVDQGVQVDRLGDVLES